MAIVLRREWGVLIFFLVACPFIFYTGMIFGAIDDRTDVRAGGRHVAGSPARSGVAFDSPALSALVAAAAANTDAGADTASPCACDSPPVDTRPPSEAPRRVSDSGAPCVLLSTVDAHLLQADDEIPTAAAPSTGKPTSVDVLQQEIDCWCLQGSWVEAPEIEPMQVAIAALNNDSCCPVRARPPIYQWVPPADCSPQPYRWYMDLLHDMTPVLQGKQLFLVGDSLTRNMYQGLQRKYWHLVDPPTNFTELADFSRNNHVLNAFVPQAVPDEGSGIRPIHLTEVGHYLTTGKYRFVVFNNGLHYRNASAYLQTYREIIAFTRFHQPGALIFIRSTPVGVVACMHHDKFGPLNATYAQYLWARKENDVYNWPRILYNNELLKRMIQREYGPSNKVFFVDVNHATSMRVDSHRVLCGDCLHYCDPGASDMWIDVLFNAFLRARALRLA